MATSAAANAAATATAAGTASADAVGQASGRIAARLGDLTLHAAHLAAADFGVDANTLLEENLATPGFFVLGSDGEPLGLVSRIRFFEALSSRFGRSLYLEREVASLLERAAPPLRFPASTPIGDAAIAALSRPPGELQEPLGVRMPDGSWRLLATQDLLIALADILRAQKETIETASRAITESIEYASLIQRAILPRPARLAAALREYFLVWEPRDQVGGDCYWLRETETGVVVVVVDCTGHGVPGAFLTLIVTSYMDNLLGDRDTHPVEDPGALLTRLHDRLRATLHGDQERATHDGCDAAACFINLAERRVRYAAAGIPLLIARPEGVETVRAARLSLGDPRTPAGHLFKTREIPVDGPMRCYLATDGVTDVIGGPKRIAYGRRRLKALLARVQEAPMTEQREAILAALRDWSAGEPVRDDMTMLGFYLAPDGPAGSGGDRRAAARGEESA